MDRFGRFFTLVSRGVTFVAVVALALGGGFSQPVSAQPTYRGVAYTGRLAVHETTSEINARQHNDDKKPKGPTRVAVDNGPDFGSKLNNPASAGLVQGPGNGQLPLLINATAPQTIGLNFDGPSSSTPCATPPDTMGAVGPTQFVVTLNCNFVSYNKTTGVADGFLNATPNVFFNSVRGGLFMSDPHVRYDRTSGRWFIVMITVGLPNSIMIAVSSGSSITATSTWSLFTIPVTSIPGRTNCLADYPTPGIDANAIYIGVNEFCGASLNSASYLTSDAFVVQKSSVLGAGPIKVTGFGGLYNSISQVGPFTPQGVDNPDPAATEGYMIGVDGGNWGLLQLRRISNPGADPTGATPPTISGNISITTPLQSSPFSQPHLGNTGGLNGEIDGSDGRLLGAYFRDGSLWTSLDSASDSTCSSTVSNNRDAVFWYEITGIPTGSTPTLRQDGAVCDTSASASPLYYSYGTIMVNGQGQAVVGYTIAGATTYTETGFSGRLKSDPLSTLEGINLTVTGSHPYNPSFDNGSSGFRRWGDFSYVSLDPCDDQTLWSIQEYASADNTYGERISQLKAPPPATPATATSVATGLANASVTVTGTSSGGSGFYDTPSSLTDPCRTRLTASVSGGVTVNSVTFTDPTHVTLNVSTVGAAAGLKNVTITNPDGQSLTGTGILSVTGASLTSTTTAVTSNSNPSVFGQSVTFTATVTPTSGTGTPTGSATFTIDGTPGSPVSISSGKATLTTSTLGVGNHTVSAAYSGDASFAASLGSLGSGQTVNKANTTLGLASNLNPSVFGQAVTFTATVSASAPGSGVRTGSATFTIDGTPGSPVTINSSGVATFTTSSLAAGTHTVSASYSGDTNFAASNSSLSGGQVVNKASTQISVVPSANPSLAGQTVTFTVTLTPTPAGLTIDGSVDLTINGVVSTIVLAPADQNVIVKVSGPLPQGEIAVSATYSGSANFSASGPSNLTQAVNGLSFFPIIANQ